MTKHKLEDRFSLKEIFNYRIVKAKVMEIIMNKPFGNEYSRIIKEQYDQMLEGDMPYP